jgi:serine/threonine protein kinase
MTTEFHDPLLGLQFGKEGRLQITARLNSGGVGTVYEAWDSKASRRVAMKFLHAEGAGCAEITTRFKREGQRFADLKHSSIVEVFGLGKEHGLLYIACEFVEGRNLTEILEQDGAFEIEAALRICRDVASAMQAAHEARVVHRDLKPDNIMIRDDDGRVMLLDFGIAKPMDSNTMLTRVGTYLGTPGYSAPEQIKGLDIDHRADIFPLGVILYELITGKLAFGGRTTQQILTSSLKAKPIPVMKVNGTVPKPVARLIDRMMHKNRNKRLQSMAEVVAAIDGLQLPMRDDGSGIGAPGAPGSRKRLLTRKA